MRLVQKTTNNIKNIEAEIQDNLFLPPFEILIIDCPIIAHPHIAPKNPQVVFAIPCPIASLFAFHLVSVSSSIRVKVMRDSVSQITASIAEYGIIILSISTKLTSIRGI